MKRILIILSILITATLTTFAGESRPWEDVSRPNDSRELIRDGVEGEDIDITVKEGWVYVTTQKPVTVKIFTILGQLITSETIRPGTKRIHISSRGIYILRAGSVTRRITI